MFLTQLEGCLYFSKIAPFLDPGKCSLENTETSRADNGLQKLFASLCMPMNTPSPVKQSQYSMVSGKLSAQPGRSTSHCSGMGTAQSRIHPLTMTNLFSKLSLPRFILLKNSKKKLCSECSGLGSNRNVQEWEITEVRYTVTEGTIFLRKENSGINPHNAQLYSQHSMRFISF
jgi:hypothetical protein